MEFSLDRFYRLNRKAIIWLVLFGVIYLLRDFFTLIFLTFIISFFAFPACQYLSRKLRMSQGFAVVLVYLAIFLSYIALYVLVLPNVVIQASSIRAKLPSIQAKINEARADFSEKYPNLVWLFNVDEESSLLTREEISHWPSFVQSLNSPNLTSAHIRTFLPAEIVEGLQDLNIIYSNNAVSLSLTSTVAAVVTTNSQGQATSTSATNSSPNEVESSLDNEPVQATRQSITEFKDRLIGALNRHVIENPAFYKEEVFADINDALANYPEIQRLIEQQKQGGTESSPRIIQKLNRRLLEQAFPSIRQQEYLTEKKLEAAIDGLRRKLQEVMPNFALAMLKFFGNSLLAILFSFLIVFDYARLSKEVAGLANSKLRDFFREAGQPVVKFAISVGQGFRAIATIAFITMIMVVIALLILGIGSVAFLAVVTFVTSLVPVVGIFFEVIPVCLVALNEHGPERALWAFAALMVIHVIIGYVITPIIFGRQFKINLVAVLFILFIGNQVAGVWGMILGVPIANYLLRNVLGVPMLDERPASESAQEEEPELANQKSPNP